MTKRGTSKRNRKAKWGVTTVRLNEREYVCPVCLDIYERKDMTAHHVHYFMDGGHARHWNMLLICKDCHGRCTSGAAWSLVAFNAVCTRFMLYKYGALFALQHESFRKTFTSVYNFCVRDGDNLILLEEVRKIDRYFRGCQDEYILAQSAVLQGRESCREIWGYDI